MLRDSGRAYGWVSIVLHWSMALAIFGLFGLGLWMTRLDYYDAWYHRAPELHKAIGMLLLFALLLRMAWRLLNAHPLPEGKPWEKLAAISMHRVQYVFMLVVAVSGYLIPTGEGQGIDVFGWFSVPALFEFEKRQADLIGQLHLITAWVLVVLAVLHAAAALKHHFVDRDATMTRMLGLSHKSGGFPDNLRRKQQGDIS